MGCNTFYHTALCLSNKVDKGSKKGNGEVYFEIG